jgi:hypothetical protein
MGRRRARLYPGRLISPNIKLHPLWVLTKRNDNREVEKVEKGYYEQAFSFFLLLLL